MSSLWTRMDRRELVSQMGILPHLEVTGRRVVRPGVGEYLFCGERSPRGKPVKQRTVGRSRGKTPEGALLNIYRHTVI
jgi:hypothetical protein